jgi:hypothetical protein
MLLDFWQICGDPTKKQNGAERVCDWKKNKKKNIDYDC